MWLQAALVHTCCMPTILPAEEYGLPPEVESTPSIRGKCQHLLLFPSTSTLHQQMFQIAVKLLFPFPSVLDPVITPFRRTMSLSLTLFPLAGVYRSSFQKHLSPACSLPVNAFPSGRVTGPAQRSSLLCSLFQLLWKSTKLS